MKVNRRVLFVIVILLIVLALALANPPPRPAAAQTNDTATVTRGNITETVSGSGTISAEDTIELSFQTSGTVSQIPVEEGDTVEKGQALARLDDRLLQIEVASAQAKLASAKAKLSKTKAGAYEEEIASAKATIQKAQAAYDLAVKESESLDFELAAQKLAMDKAQVSVNTAQAAYDRIGGASNSSIGLTQQSKELQTATLDYQNAQAKYKALLTTYASSKKSKLESAKADIEKAKADLATLQTRAQDIAMDQASLDQAEQSLQQAQVNLEYATIKAPFAGVITAVNVVTGTRTTNAQIAIEMMNVTPLHIKLKLGENDIVKVQNHQRVQIKTDSLKDWQAEGTVTYIAPSGETINGVVTYIVRVDFTTADTRVKVGMTANLEIITAQKENVLMVPNAALLPKGNARVLQVVTGGDQVKEVEVQTGLSDGIQTEITGDIAEGARIVALPSETKAQPSPGLFGSGR